MLAQRLEGGDHQAWQSRLGAGQWTNTSLANLMYRDPTPEEQALRDEVRKDYPYLIDRETWGKKISGPALGAKNVKRMLAHEFPGIKFQSSSDLYAGGSTIYVRWDDMDGAPSHAQVDGHIDALFSSQRFNGSDDSTKFDKDERRKAFRALFGGASYVSAQRNTLSPEERAQRQNNDLEHNTAPVTATRRGPRL